MEKIYRFYNNRSIYKLHLACTLYGDVGMYTVVMSVCTMLVYIHCIVMLVCTLYSDVSGYTVW